MSTPGGGGRRRVGKRQNDGRGRVASGSGQPFFDREHDGTCRSTSTRSSGRAPSVIRLHSYDDAITWSTPAGQRHRDLHQRRRRRPRYENEVEAGMVGINVPVPGPWLGTTPSGAGRPRCSTRHPRARHRGLQLLHPQQGHHHPLAGPQPRRPELSTSHRTGEHRPERGKISPRPPDSSQNWIGGYVSSKLHSGNPCRGNPGESIDDTVNRIQHPP